MKNYNEIKKKQVSTIYGIQMRKYDFDKMDGIWKDEARKIIENGFFIAHSGNFDMWEYNGIIFSIPVSGSGCGASVWCGISSLRPHLYRLRQLRGYDTLIPPDWKNVNTKFLSGFGIA